MDEKNMTDTNGRIPPNVRVVRYHTTPRAAVQAFVDLEIGDVLRVNGVHLMRDGSIGPPRLTPVIHGKRAFIPAVEILNPGLLESLTAAIQTAIHAHLETLPPGERMKPPELRKSVEQPPAVAASEKPAPAAAAPAKPKPVQTVSTKPAAEKPKLPPPLKLSPNNTPQRSRPVG